MKQRDRFFALLTALSLLLGLLAGCGSTAAAATMKLRKSTGTVRVLDDGGAALEAQRDLGLYSGYEVRTRDESYAWIDLDEVKLTKLDQDSSVEITQNGGNLELRLKSGSLFFNITEPLEADESLEIRTSTMVVGIRGTCGWVTEDSVALLEGTVSVTAGEQSAAVNAGEMAVVTEDGEITVLPLSDEDIPAFVRDEFDEEELLSLIPEEPEPEPQPEPEPAPEPEPEPEPAEPLPVRSFYYDLISPELSRRTEYTYTERGDLLQEDHYDIQSGELIAVTTYHYDELGRLTRDETRRPNGPQNELVSYTEYTYPDGEDGPTEVRRYDADGTLIFYQVIDPIGSWDEIDPVTGEETHYRFGELRDAQGRLIQRDILNADWETVSHTTYEHDDQGRVSREDHYDGGDDNYTRQSYTIFEYE